MRGLSAEELDRLVRSNRRLKIALTATVCLVVVGVVLLVMSDADFVIRGGAGLGVLIGLLLVIPNRRVVRGLGLTTEEAREILQDEKERRNGVAAMPASVRANRDALRGRILLVIGLVLMAALVVSAWYFFGKAGETVEEDAPLDPWFVASFVVGFLALFFGIPALMSSAKYRRSAAEWRDVAGE